MTWPYPSLIGRISLDSSPLPRFPVQEGVSAEPILSHPNDLLQAFRLQRARDVHAVIQGDEAAILAGSIYAASTPFVDMKSDPRKLLAWSRSAQLSQTDGTFFMMYATWHDSSYEVRFATDKYGFKTIYFCELDRVLYFAGHLSGLRHMLGRRLSDVSHKALLHFYHFGITPSDLTLFEGVRKVPAGSVLSVKPGSVSVSRYFDPLDLYQPQFYRRSSVAEVSEELDARMTAAVESRVGDDKLGLAISGGVDSGYIAQKLKDACVPFTGYNLSYGHYDEHGRLDVLSRTIGVETVRMSVSASEILDSFEAANAVASEPVHYNDAAMRLLALRAKEDGVGDLWDGDGADRLFLGMNRHKKYFRVHRAFQILKRFHMVVPLSFALYRTGHPEARKLAVILQNWLRGIPSYTERKYSEAEIYDAGVEKEIFELAVQRIWKDFDSRVGEHDFGLFLTYFSLRLCPEMFFHTPAEQQSILRMRPISPYWDDRVVSIALSIPVTLKIRNGKTKYILRKSASLMTDDKYWMLPKIGLHNALPLIKNDSIGREWISAEYEKITRAAEYEYLCSILRTSKPDPSRLIPYLAWLDAQSGRNIPRTTDASVGAL